jgi:hypothetical protein
MPRRFLGPSKSAIARDCCPHDRFLIAKKLVLLERVVYVPSRCGAASRNLHLVVLSQKLAGLTGLRFINRSGRTTNASYKGSVHLIANSVALYGTQEGRDDLRPH